MNSYRHEFSFCRKFMFQLSITLQNQKMLNIVKIGIMVLDKGFDAEPVHKEIREAGAISMIPVRGDHSISSTSGKYRKLMKRKFDKTIYHERNKTETIFSVIKTLSSSHIMKTKELLCRVMAL